MNKTLKKLLTSSGLLIFLLSSVALADPAQVILIRHAEKPDDVNNPNLSEQGYQRAAGLPKFFMTNPDVLKFGTPVAIYAMAPHGENGTMRPIETITPLAKALGLQPVEKYEKKHFKEMVSEIMNTPAYEGKMVLICWEHAGIIDVATEFRANNIPIKWKDQVFDDAWVLNFENKTVTYSSVFEDILVTDMPSDIQH